MLNQAQLPCNSAPEPNNFIIVFIIKHLLVHTMFFELNFSLYVKNRDMGPNYH